MLRFFLTCFCLFCLSTAAQAAECNLRPGQTGQVVEVVDGDTIRLASGEKIRLVGIQAPKLSLGRKNFKAWPLAEEAKAKLEKLILNKTIQLRYGGRETDRHRRLLAHVFSGKVWVQEAMIREGFARVYSFSDNRSCVEDLLEVEARSRAKKTAMWALPHYQVKQAADIEQLSTLHNSFQIIRGKVLSVGETKGKTYLNFGEIWKTDFTGEIKKRHLRYFKKHPLKLKELAGKEVLIRGWLGFHNGPKIDISHPEQIEILKTGGLK